MSDEPTWGHIIDLSAARERMQSGASLREKSTHPILEALDALALALANHGHTWTERERNLYETSVAYLNGGQYE